MTIKGYAVPSYFATFYDVERTKELEGAGIRVLRFWNNQVLTETEYVLLALFEALAESPSPGASRHPLPEGEGLV